MVTLRVYREQQVRMLCVGDRLGLAGHRSMLAYDPECFLEMGLRVELQTLDSDVDPFVSGVLRGYGSFERHWVELIIETSDRGVHYLQVPYRMVNLKSLPFGHLCLLLSLVLPKLTKVSHHLQRYPAAPVRLLNVDTKLLAH